MSRYRILIVGSWLHDWHEQAWQRALTDLGHDVSKFSYFGDVSIPSFSTRVQNRLLVGPTIRRMNQRLISRAREAKPDIIVYYRAIPIRAATIERIKSETNALVVTYNNDSIVPSSGPQRLWENVRESIARADVNLIYRPSDRPIYDDLGSKNSYVLRSHYLPWLHCTGDNGSKSVDCGFYGHFESDGRDLTLRALMDAVPAEYAVRGDGWNKSRVIIDDLMHATTPIYGPEYVQMIRSTRIALVFFSTINQDEYTRRVFEIPATGTFMLAPRTSEMQELFQEDEEVVLYASTEELVDKVRYYLAHPSEREAIALNGLRRVRTSGYSIYSRMNEWLQQVVES